MNLGKFLQTFSRRQRRPQTWCCCCRIMKKIHNYPFKLVVLLALIFSVLFMFSTYVTKFGNSEVFSNSYTSPEAHQIQMQLNELPSPDPQAFNLQTNNKYRDITNDDTNMLGVKPFYTESDDVIDVALGNSLDIGKEKLEGAILRTVLEKIKTKNVSVGNYFQVFEQIRKREPPAEDNKTLQDPQHDPRLSRKQNNGLLEPSGNENQVISMETVQECRARIERSERVPYWSARKYTNPCWRERGSLHCVPYFFVVGFPKCGTTDIYMRMKLHPGFVAPQFKEVHWITRFRFFPVVQDADQRPTPGAVKGFDKDFQQYYNVFSPLAQHLEACDHHNSRSNSTKHFDTKQKCYHQISGDFSPSTIWDADLYRGLDVNYNLSFPKYIAADFVYKMNPCAKIIVMLRNPTDRLYSDYLHFHKHTTPKDFHHLVLLTIDTYNKCFSQKTIKECIYNDTLAHNNYIGQLVRLRQGIYYVYILDWLERFPQNQLHIVHLEDYSKNTRIEMKKVFSFLEMDQIKNSEMELIVAEKPANARQDRYKGESPPEMLKKTRKIIQDFYRPFNAKLAEVLEDNRYLQW